MKKKEKSFSLSEMLKFVKRFVETGRLEDHPRSGRASLTEGRVSAVESVIEDKAAESSTGCCSAHGTGKILGQFESSIRHIFHKVLDLYPYKLGSLHQIKPIDIDTRESFAK